MDFSSLKQKFSDFTKTATEKAKELGNKALEFAGDNLAKTSLFVQTEDEYKKILENKKVILIAFDEKHEIEKPLMKMLPIWQTQSWIDSANLRYLTREKSDFVIMENGFQLPFEMRIFLNGIEMGRENDVEMAKKWWSSKNRNYEKPFIDTTSEDIVSEKTEENNKSQNISDPLHDITRENNNS